MTVTTLHRTWPLARSAEMTGEWSGVVGTGGAIRFGARLASGPCGLLVGTFSSPDQGQLDLPMTAVAERGDSLVLEAAYLGLRLALPLRGGEERRALLTQPNVHAVVSMRRGGTLLHVRRPQEPERPFPYVEREVMVASRAPGIRLSGALTLPDGSGPHPAVVLIGGSGAQDRDETIAGHRPFLVLSDRLTRAGYAVLRLDDRGMGRSNGTALGSGLHDLADDVRGALVHLRALPEIDARRIGLLGHSEGGYVAQIVAADDPALAFLVLLGAPAVRGRDLFAAQRSVLARASGAAERVVRVDSLLLAQVFAVLDRAPSDEALASTMDSALTRWRQGLGPADRAVADSLLAARTAVQDSASLLLWRSSWFEAFYRHDPAPLLRRIRVPTYVVIGALDLQVPPAQSIPAYEAAFAGDRRGALTVEHPASVNHMLQTAATGRIEEYVTIDETIAPVVLDGLTEWLARTVPAREP